MGRYKSVRSFSRGLEVLKALNCVNGLRAPELSAVTGIHRATIHRLLETLREGGFVESSGRGDVFYLTRDVMKLSEGFSEENYVPRTVVPALHQLQRKVRWPTNFATFSAPSMVVRESTAHMSPLSTHRVNIGLRIPVLHCALGRAYLGYCDEAAHDRLLSALCPRGTSAKSRSRARQQIRSVAAATRACGYGTSPSVFWPDAQTDPAKFSAIAVPAFRGGRLIGSLNVLYFANSLSAKDAERTLLPHLREAVGAIERASEIADEHCSAP